MIVNLIGAPGAGKSTTRADTFRILKQNGVKCEECTEYAKDLVWEERALTLSSQPYIFSKQLRNMERVIGKVDVLITDSPLILNRYYTEKYRAGVYPDSFLNFVSDQFIRMGGITYLIERVHAYETIGRSQSQEQSDEVGLELVEMLDRFGITYKRLLGNNEAGPLIAADIMAHLG
ncbi:MAG: hypothetical protein EOP84_03745 [Verrucomicrobiaceae bacterium]|nr:MAG: hypothetical protein EOP84_03745 [Verrucomicrobiaceae bacterium]